MSSYIDKKFWENSLKKLDWYSLLQNDFNRLEELAKDEKDYDKRKLIKKDAYNSIIATIKNDSLPIAKTGDNLDIKRKPIDTIVIHHTNNKPDMTLEKLNAMHLMILYGKYYANKSKKTKQPVWSGHFYNDQQVFWGYHWLIRSDGTTQQILKDNYIGWHAGNWDINTRSIGICIDDDLNDKEPSLVVIKSIAKLIKDNYPDVSLNKVIGHCDVYKKTKCPGRLFRESWRQKLIDTIKLEVR